MRGLTLGSILWCGSQNDVVLVGLLLWISTLLAVSRLRHGGTACSISTGTFMLSEQSSLRDFSCGIRKIYSLIGVRDSIYPYDRHKHLHELEYARFFHMLCRTKEGRRAVFRSTVKACRGFIQRHVKQPFPFGAR
jgi:hypothetical protein